MNGNKDIDFLIVHVVYPAQPQIMFGNIWSENAILKTAQWSHVLSKSNLTFYQSKKKMNTYNTIKLFHIPVKINNILKHFNDFNGIFPENVQNLSV